MRCSFTCPLIQRPKNTPSTAPSLGNAACVFTLRRNSSCIRSTAFAPVATPRSYSTPRPPRSRHLQLNGARAQGQLPLLPSMPVASSLRHALAAPRPALLPRSSAKPSRGECASTLLLESRQNPGASGSRTKPDLLEQWSTQLEPKGCTSLEKKVTITNDSWLRRKFVRHSSIRGSLLRWELSLSCNVAT